MPLSNRAKELIKHAMGTPELADEVISLLEAAETIEASELNVDDNVTMNDFKITDLADPEDPQDAATKAWVEANAGGFANPATEDLDMDGNNIIDVRNITVATDLDVLVTDGNDVWLTAQNASDLTTIQVGDKYVEISCGDMIHTYNGLDNTISILGATRINMGNSEVLNLPSVAGDPASPSDGDIWHNTTTDTIRVKLNGSLYTLDATIDP